MESIEGSAEGWQIWRGHNGHKVREQNTIMFQRRDYFNSVHTSKVKRGM